MTIRVQLSEQEELALRRKAEVAGQNLQSYAADMLKRDAHRPVRTIEQIASDIAQRRGDPLNMSEDAVAEMLEKAKHAMREERSRRKRQ